MNQQPQRSSVGCVTRPTCLILTIVGVLILMGSCLGYAIQGH